MEAGRADARDEEDDDWLVTSHVMLKLQLCMCYEHNDVYAKICAKHATLPTCFLASHSTSFIGLPRGSVWKLGKMGRRATRVLVEEGSK